MHACYPPCEVCREREERATQPAPQAGSSGEGLKVGDEVTPEVWDCDCGVVNWIEETCIVCESPRPKLSPQPVEAKEPWKPGMRVLIEATIGEELDDDTCDLRIHTGLPVDAWIVAKLSQLRPLPVVQGEGVGK